MLDVNRLRVIDAVARHGSVTAAANELHYSQPSVTHHIARLEAETGAQLLQRVGRGIRLTAPGRPPPRAPAARHPGLEIGLIDPHPPEAIDMLRTGEAEVALIFRYDET